jgi:hypothetical protein
MSDQMQRTDYLKEFSGDRQKEALKQALDIRKFEIDLYWKRAAYFWTFIAAAFAAYFTLQGRAEFASIYVVTCLGFLFSLAWYFVNRGSGAWQRNWETHVDLLEDEIMGPLYKTTLNRRTYKFHHIAEPFSFSPSRINNILALSVATVWLFLMVRTLWNAQAFKPPYSMTALFMSSFTIVVAITLFVRGRSRPSDDPISIERRNRTYS